MLDFLKYQYLLSPQFNNYLLIFSKLALKVTLMHQYSEYGNTNCLQRDQVGGVLALNFRNQEKLSIGNYFWVC